jgi:hypothetical protein
MAYRGKCFCGSVAIEAEGAPEAMGYCHCSSCRAWAAAPVNAFTLWKKESVRVTQGAEHLAMYARNPTSERQYCRKCGGHVMTWHPAFGLMDVYAALLPDLAFKPALHVNYAQSVLPIRDGLPKMRDFPAPMGGSGEVMPE